MASEPRPGLIATFRSHLSHGVGFGSHGFAFDALSGPCLPWDCAPRFPTLDFHRQSCICPLEILPPAPPPGDPNRSPPQRCPPPSGPHVDFPGDCTLAPLPTLPPSGPLPPSYPALLSNPCMRRCCPPRLPSPSPSPRATLCRLTLCRPPTRSFGCRPPPPILPHAAPVVAPLSPMPMLSNGSFRVSNQMSQTCKPGPCRSKQAQGSRWFPPSQNSAWLPSRVPPLVHASLLVGAGP